MKKKLKIEEAIVRLEEIAEIVNDSFDDIEKMADLYEEGAKLISFCNKKLDSIDKKISIVETHLNNEN